MATSGTATFNYTRDQIIASAARKIGAIAAGETLGANASQDFADALNIMVKALNATGIHIWTEAEATLFMQTGQTAYLLGSGTTDHATESYVATSLKSAAALNATTLTVNSITGINAADNIGIALDDGTLQWTTVNGAPSGSTVTITTGLTTTAAAANRVFTYTTDIVRPLRVVSGRRYVFASAIDTPMIPASRLDYRALPNKTQTGVITQFFYDARGGTNAQGQMNVCPAPVDTTAALKFTWYRPLQDFNAAGNNPDLPTEWLNALIWGLASQMAIEYDCPPQRLQMIQQQAAAAFELVSGYDREIESYLFGFSADQT